MGGDADGGERKEGRFLSAEGVVACWPFGGAVGLWSGGCWTVDFVKLKGDMLTNTLFPHVTAKKPRGSFIEYRKRKSVTYQPQI